MNTNIKDFLDKSFNNGLINNDLEVDVIVELYLKEFKYKIDINKNSKR